MIRRIVVGAAHVIAAFASPVHAQQSVAPEAAPAAWVAYADQVNARVTAWLGSDDETATRLRAYVDGTRPSPDAAAPTLALRLWVTPAGVIERIAFTPFADAAANADLEALLVGKPIGAPPPRDMVQPLRLALDVVPAPATANAPPR